MDFTPWTLFIDLGFISVLLLFGQLIRAKIVFVQKLFLPANIIAGALGLLLGPNGFDIIPFSDSISKYPGILISLIFASLPFASRDFSWRSARDTVGNLWAYSTITMLLQWGLGLSFCLIVLHSIWPEIHNGFGTILASGFVGGHGTAAAVGMAFSEFGWHDATSLAMTTATVGILSSIVGGMIWIKWAARNGLTKYVSDFKELPTELRTGLVPQDKRIALGWETISPISIDPLAFHFALIAAAAVTGYLFRQGSAAFLGKYQIPTFCLAFLAAMLLKQVLKLLRATQYVDGKSTTRICGALTDVLVAFGISSIQLSILVKYAYPLAALFMFGIILCGLLFRLLGPKMFSDLWFEKSLYTWGWVTGVMAMAIALLRIVDADNKSAILDDFVLAYLAIGPIEITLVTLAPALISNGHHWIFTIVALGAACIILIASLRAKSLWRHT